MKSMKPNFSMPQLNAHRLNPEIPTIPEDASFHMPPIEIQQKASPSSKIMFRHKNGGRYRSRNPSQDASGRNSDYGRSNMTSRDTQF